MDLGDQITGLKFLIRDRDTKVHPSVRRRVHRDRRADRPEPCAGATCERDRRTLARQRPAVSAWTRGARWPGPRVCQGRMRRQGFGTHRLPNACNRETLVGGIAVPGVAMVEPKSALSSERPDADDVEGVSLRRLLSVATLTPAQAALLALDLAGELEANEDQAGSAGPTWDWSVRVTFGGRIRLAHAGVPDVAAAVEILRQLAASAARASVHRQQDPALLTDGLTGFRGDIAALVAQVRDAAGQLLDDATEERISRVRRELVVLVSSTSGHGPATGRVAASARLTGHAATGPAGYGKGIPAAGRLRPGRGTWHRGGAPRPSRFLLPALILVVLGLVGWFGGPGAWSELQSAWHTLFSSPSASPSAPPHRSARPSAPSATPHPVQQPTPAAAGPVTRVTVQRLQATCSSGRTCPVRVYVRLNRRPAAQRVAWTFQVMNRCTGTTVTRPGTAVIAKAGWSYVYGTTYLRLPHGRALAVIAVTRSPARAASSPLLVPPGGGAC